MKVLVADKFEASGIEGLKKAGCEVAYEPAAGAEGLGPVLARVRPDVLVVRSSKVPGAVLDGAAGLRGIIRAGAGVDNIDTPAASRNGIAVCNCPGMNAVAVAELAFALLLSCDRRLGEQTAEVRAGKWNKKEYAKARGLKGTTLGIVGMGAIGRALAVRARAFDMNVLAWSRSLTPESARAAGVQFRGSTRADLLGMLAECDAVSVHVAAAAETKKMCNAEFFGAMKPGAYFINTSRGSVVDEAALREAIRAKGLRAGLDVYENQPASPQADFTSAVAALPGVTATHHCGASTDQAQQAVADEVVRMVGVYARTGRFENCVNERDLGRPRAVPAGA
ncbi:MAG: hydroxyacid dehydrogenase [Phycisphaerales bacterium]|nr:hydroxyacid dehydrogenase [Phycisphaerales bacterium]